MGDSDEPPGLIDDGEVRCIPFENRRQGVARAERTQQCVGGIDISWKAAQAFAVVILDPPGQIVRCQHRIAGLEPFGNGAGIGMPTLRPLLSLKTI